MVSRTDVMGNAPVAGTGEAETQLFPSQLSHNLGADRHANRPIDQQRGPAARLDLAGILNLLENRTG
jgi:hypothetical protein